MDETVRIHEEVLRQGNRSPDAKASVAEYVLRRWPNSDASEALLLVDIMIHVPTTSWSRLMGPAHRHEIRHWRLLERNQDRIYERIADAAADEDGLTSDVGP